MVQCKILYNPLNKTRSAMEVLLKHRRVPMGNPAPKSAVQEDSREVDMLYRYSGCPGIE